MASFFVTQKRKVAKLLPLSDKRSAFRTDLQHMACAFAKHLFDLLFISGHMIVVYKRLDRPRKAAAMHTAHPVIFQDPFA